MTGLNMKVHGFDGNTGSMIVSFSTDRSIHPVDSYPKLAFQPINFTETDPDAVIKTIAAIGLQTALRQDKMDAMKDDPAFFEPYEALVGQTLHYSSDDLATQIAAMQAPMPTN